MMTLYIICLGVQAIWVMINSFFLPGLRDRKLSTEPHVSILIPVRNEEKNIRPLINSLQKLTYSNFECIILDDNSEDKTYELLLSRTDNDRRFRIARGKMLPDGWVGKVHACHQLSLEASGDYLLFLDADVTVHPRTVERMLNAFQQETGLVTGFPQYPLKGLLGHLLVPMQHFVIYMHLPLFLANHTAWPKASAAHGACMMFHKKAYWHSGGHASVKNSLVEDVHLARLVKQNGNKTRLVNNTDTVACRMYETSREVWDGFAKNIFPGVGRNPLIMTAVILFYWLFYVLPLPLAVYGGIVSNFIFIVPLFITIVIKFFIDFMTRQKWRLSLFISFSAIAMTVLMIYSMYLSICKRGFIWKGRTYS